MTATVFLGLGSNLGDREIALDEGLRLLAERGLRLTGRSSLYETEPVGGPPQGWFLNAVVRGQTDLAPEELLAACLEVERALGRVRAGRDQPRSIDIDLLLYDDVRRETPQITVPHPRLHLRRFVLVPLAELAPQVRHPGLGLTAAQMLERCSDTARVIQRPSVARTG
jgi:2-amino-4-hydroxy-6-hydroxymethyldihydropteridine diphosphokinase